MKTLLLASLALLAAPAFAANPPGLTVGKDGAVLRDGKAYRGIGVNYFDAFYRTLKNPSDTSYEQGLAELEKRGIPFARFICGGFWPSENKLYRENKDAYFALLDAFVRSAEKHHVGLIPSLFWTTSTAPDIVGEPCNAWGDAKSKTHAFMRQYVREVVTRYRNSPAIWGWEFGNEYNLGADLPNASEHRPPIVPDLGTPTTRSKADELTHAEIRAAFAAFAREVRRYDRTRLIVTGNAFPRPSAWHQMHEGNWTQDTLEQSVEMLLGDNPDPVDTLTVHAYGDYERITPAMETAVRAMKPLFVGEFGVPGPPSEENRAKFAQMLALIEKVKAPLSALWVYDYAGQDKEWNVTAANERSYQLDAVAKANAAIGK